MGSEPKTNLLFGLSSRIAVFELVNMTRVPGAASSEMLQYVALM